MPRGLAVVQPKVAGRLVHWPGALPSDWPPPSARRAPPTQSPIPKMPTSQRPKLRREHRPKMASRGVRHSTATISSQSTQHDQRARFLTQDYTRYVRIQCTSNGFTQSRSLCTRAFIHSASSLVEFVAPLCLPACIRFPSSRPHHSPKPSALTPHLLAHTHTNTRHTHGITGI